MKCIAAMIPAYILILGAGGVSGQDYPNKLVRIITGSVGGGVDFVARIVGPGISGPLGQPVVIENRGGGVAPGEAAAKVPSDGYTLLITSGTLWVTPLIRKVSYD